MSQLPGDKHVGFVIWTIIAISGGLIGGTLGAHAAGYLVIFKSLAHIASMTDSTQWTKLFEGLIILIFTKGVVIAGAITGGFFGSAPGIIGMAHCDDCD